ncbi:MAG: tRNA (adenosine(37)-N6)-threonylcarbamoyltransferase complex dimerization subunit type 1 TsaB, partial [Luteolibacter sp.]
RMDSPCWVHGWSIENAWGLDDVKAWQPVNCELANDVSAVYHSGVSELRALIFETSTPHATLARVDAGGCVNERGFSSDRNHNALLFGPLDELLGDDRKVDLVLVGSGPGSYSGTRVGIAAAQGVAIAMGCAAVAVPSLLAVPSVASGKAALAIGDARRGSYWTARVEDFKLDAAPSLCDAAGLHERVAQALDEGLVVFSCEEIARFPLPEDILAKLSFEIPSAKRLWQAWQSTDEATRRAWSAEIPQPIYIKPPHITPAKPRSSTMRVDSRPST